MGAPVNYGRASASTCLAAWALLLADHCAQADDAKAAAEEMPGALPYELAFTMRELVDVTIAPNGKRVAYVVMTPPSQRVQTTAVAPNGTPIDAQGNHIHIAELETSDGATNAPVCAARGNQWQPSWSPDGQMLAFYSDADGPAQLWVYALKTGECRKVAAAHIKAHLGGGYDAKWSPDASTLYVPLHPNPPSPISVAAPTERSDRGEPSPRIYFSGSENRSPHKSEGERFGEADEAVMLDHQYGATPAAIDLRSGAIRAIVPAEAKPPPDIRLRVSPSGRWISYRSVYYRHEDVVSPSFVADLAIAPTPGGPSRVIIRGLQASTHDVNYLDLDYRWHPTQDSLIYVKDGGLWRVDFGVNGPKKPRQLARELGELAPVVAYFTADGRAIAVGTQPDGQGGRRVPRGLAIVPLDGGRPVTVALPDKRHWQFLDMVRANEDVLWQPDPRFVSVQLRERSSGEYAVVEIDVATNRTRTLTQCLCRLNALGAGDDRRYVLGIYEDVGTPPNLYRFAADFSRKEKLSAIDPRLTGMEAGSAQVFSVRAPLHDGTLATVRTTLLLPRWAERGRPLPAIVMIYSGSDLSTRASYFGGGTGNTVPNLLFTSRGFAVVMADVRLSAEGEGSYPVQHMVDVLLAQVYRLANEGYVDIDHLAVSGQSYGGYSTAAIVSHTNLFRAGIPINGPFDLASFYGVLDGNGIARWARWSEKSQGRMGHSPWADIQRYIDNSPYYRIDRIHTPLLIVAGEQDHAVPHEESKKLFVGLRRLGRPAQLLIYPGEGHIVGMWSTPNAIDVSQRMVAFLTKHLGDPARP